MYCMLKSLVILEALKCNTHVTSQKPFVTPTSEMMLVSCSGIVQ